MYFLEYKNCVESVGDFWFLIHVVLGIRAMRKPSPDFEALARKINPPSTLKIP
jgi:hypothetical protein